MNNVASLADMCLKFRGGRDTPWRKRCLYSIYEKEGRINAMFLQKMVGTWIFSGYKSKCKCSILLYNNIWTLLFICYWHSCDSWHRTSFIIIVLVCILEHFRENANDMYRSIIIILSWMVRL
jgi:hypothetical protein